MEKLERRIESFLGTRQGDFDALALELFAYQYEHNLPYQHYCRAQNRVPGSVADWREIPAVPVEAFRTVDFLTVPTRQAAAIFHSSCTNGMEAGRHYFRDLMFYESSAKSGFGPWVVPKGTPLTFIILSPSPAEAPHSSLVWMFEVVRKQWGTPRSDYFFSRGALEGDRLFLTLERYEKSGEPLVLLGTTLAFLSFFDRCERQKRTFRLSTESRLMDTGGMKTERRSVTRSEFLRQVWTSLGIPEGCCVNEYGMCELSSQFYARGAAPVFQGPPWARVLTVDPEDGSLLPQGTTGLLRFVDLANVDSVLAVQTQDLGLLEPDGFRFLGRAEAAGLKGCSLALETYMQ